MRRERALKKLKVFGYTLVFFIVWSASSGCLPGEHKGADARPERSADMPGAGKGDPKIKKIKPLPVADWNQGLSKDWAEVKKLEDEQKLQAAQKVILSILDRARAEKNSEEWVKALITAVQLKSALHEYETAVRFFKEQPWPDDLLGQVTCNLYYAQMLVWYARNYRWEIQRRERVDTKGKVDLKAWTLEQIFAEAGRAYLFLWRHKQELANLDARKLAAYIEVGDYPHEVRPGLLDVLTYFWTNLLADRDGWRPRQRNEVFALDLGKLLGTARPMSARFKLDDPNIHPLVKLSALLADLEYEHSKKGLREAALEAYIERSRQLWNAFSQEQDKTEIEKKMAARLAHERGISWWSVGIAQMAQWVRQKRDPHALVQAHELAQKGWKKYPDSIGGKQCRSIVESIEQPGYALQGMATDAPGKKSILVRHKNLKEIFFRAYKLDLLKIVRKADDYDIFPRWEEIRKIMKREPAASWRKALPKTPDFRMHKTFVTPPMKKPGYYLVIASAKKDFGPDDNYMTALNVIISDLVLVEEIHDSGVEVTAVSGATGRPVPGVKISLYKYDWTEGHHVVQTKTTSGNGVVGFTSYGGDYFLLARKGEQIVMDPNYLNIYANRFPESHTGSLVYTDRSVYRPGQKLHFKIVVYSGRRKKADYHTIAGRRVRVWLEDANRRTVADATYHTNENGTVSGSFDIPPGRLLGQWHLYTSPEGSAPVRVEEYKRPTFEVKIDDPKTPLRLNKPAVLEGRADYYFGLPVTSGKVLWRVVRSPRYPWWWSWWYGNRGSASQVVATGTAKLAGEGKFKVSFTPKADERTAKAGVTYVYELEADVTDEGGETRSAKRSFRLGFVAVEATIGMDEEFVFENKPSMVKLTRTNLDGVAAPGTGKWRLLKIVQPGQTLAPADQPLPEALPGVQGTKGYQTAGDRQRARWQPGYNPMEIMRQWKDGSRVAGGEVVHDKQGRAKIKMPPLPAGAYRLRYETKDAFGKVFSTSRDIIVAARNVDIRLPLLFRVEKPTVHVGETARILVHSGFKDQLLFLETFRDGKRQSCKRIVAGEDPAIVEIPVTEDLRGGLGLVLWAVRDHQFMQITRTLFVPWDNHELKVSFSRFRDKLKPGQKETWTVKVEGPDGSKSAVKGAEVLAYMYDRSLDMFASHNPPSPISIFPTRYDIAYTRPSLYAARASWLSCSGFKNPAGYPDLRPASLKFISGYGIGGMGYGGGGGVLALRAAPGRKSVAMPTRGRKRRAMKMKTMDKEMEDALSEQDRSGVAGLGEVTVAGALEKPAENKLESGGEAPQRPQPVIPRTDFSETAFFLPELLTSGDGSVSFTFKVPESVTSWNVWAHAITRDLSSGSKKEEARTIKDLMVRPYLPRFLREGDIADLKVVVNNASDKSMQGELEFDIQDPKTKQSMIDKFGLSKEKTKRRFTVKAKGGTSLVFKIRVPAKLGLVAVQAIARSGDISDGERRALPVLPGRMHLIQSRFVTLDGKSRRTLHFADMEKNDDPTRIDEQLVVTLDAQLFYSVLAAVPYLVKYPYECSEQLLNRFLSAGILASMYKDYPAVAKMAKKLSVRKTRLERFDQPDPNRKMALEETPWLVQAGGGDNGYEKENGLVNVLDPRLAESHKRVALGKLKKAQTLSGGFPWFPGGPPSPYITLYLLYGFSKGLEFGVQVPRDMVQRAWQYEKRHYIDRMVPDCMSLDACWEEITFLNYVISSYKDETWTGGVFSGKDRKTMLDFSFKHWKQHSPLLKAYLALTLNRMGRHKDARLVWDSVMDSAKTDPDLGTYWAPEDRSWLWYNDTIETHAFALRTELELAPNDKRIKGLVQWLLLNKKMNHWKSTKATAEVVYSLAEYMKKTRQLEAGQSARIVVGDVHKNFVFKPDEYTGKSNHLVLSGKELDPEKCSTIEAENHSKGMMFVSATWHFSTERLPGSAKGDLLKVKREYFRRVKTGSQTVLKPLVDGEPIEVGDEIEVHISLTSGHPVGYVHLRDPRPAGCEPVSFRSRYRWELGIYWYEEVRDSGMNFFFEQLPQGEYPLIHRMRAAVAGTFKVAPAIVQPMYAPEFAAYSAGNVVEIRPSR
ncbi:MAG: hypothetical protein GXP49_04950 [Deltaproteobacteria bacterium]|nr:hypothetical protein [Deltaproteobacteria bacterium]